VRVSGQATTLDDHLVDPRWPDPVAGVDLCAPQHTAPDGGAVEYRLVVEFDGELLTVNSVTIVCDDATVLLKGHSPHLR